MSRDIRITYRDIKLLEFLAEYKIMSLDNSKYIYETITYQEKRIVVLVKHGYIKRLKHRYITLGIKGRDLLLLYGVEIRKHCRNANNMERLNVISDISSFITFNENMEFTPSWQLKDVDSPTTRSRRYLGVIRMNDTDFLTYSIYENKSRKYITSVYYDIEKEREHKHIIVFTNDVKELIYRKKQFSFGKRKTFLVAYTEYNKFILRNYLKIGQAIYNNIKNKYITYESEVDGIDFMLEDKRYVKIMPIIEMEAIRTIKANYAMGNYKGKSINIFCLEEDKDIIGEYLPKAVCIGIKKSEIQDLIDGKILT